MGTAAIAGTTPVTKQVFIVIMKEESGATSIDTFGGTDNELLMTGFRKVEQVVYSGSWPVAAPRGDGSNVVANSQFVPINIDMKAKRKLSTGDTIQMYMYMTTPSGTGDSNCIVAGCSTVIAT